MTEILFAIGAGPNVVGVTSFDRYPPSVRNLPALGGLLDPNAERLLALKPDLVVTYRSQASLLLLLERASVPVVTYAHGDLDSISRSMRAIGVAVGRSDEGERVARALEDRLASIQARVRGRPRPAVALIIGHERGSRRGLLASGGYGFLHDLIEIAGARDVMADVHRESVAMSTETILARAPEVIIDLRAGPPPPAATAERERQAWRSLPAVPAVQTGRIYFLSGDEFVTPGPRIADAAEGIARLLHPGAF